ncbi:MAG: hypothetical protein HYS73_00240 [Parcubacteria group bacterium]|nr:hypothetical protein [Parcubacteria group bacterium]MBI2049021.1 hypothetical protein [Parcubacteria group bacterium]
MEEIPKKIQMNAAEKTVSEPFLEAKREELENTPPPRDEWDVLIEGDGGEEKSSV